jgi:hypothetical protein
MIAGCFCSAFNANLIAGMLCGFLQRENKTFLTVIRFVAAGISVSAIPIPPERK